LRRRDGVANRFVRRIKSGHIESIEELKSEFKELAKRTHPDLGGPGGEAEFVEARAEYETALRDFEKHRFGASRREDRDSVFGASGRDGKVAERPGSAAEGPMPDAAWPCFLLLLKRGFPKLPRHEKELLRYEYARWRLAQALGPIRASLFRDFESELLDLKAFGSEALPPTIGLLRDLVEYRYVGLAAMRTNVVLSLGRMRSDARLGAPVRDFIGFLAEGAGIGGELGGGTAT
jgi:hypothetical protein